MRLTLPPMCHGDIDAGSTFPRKKGRKVVAAKRSGKVQGSSNQRSADLLQGLSELLDLVPQMESSAEQLACMVGTHFFSSYERNSSLIVVVCLVIIFLFFLSTERNPHLLLLSG